MRRRAARSGSSSPATGAGPLKGNLRVAAAGLLLVGGLIAMLIGGGALAGSWYASQSWAATDEAEQANRQLAAETPRWVDDPAAMAPRRSTPTTVAVAAPPTPMAPPARTAAAPASDSSARP